MTKLVIYISKISKYKIAKNSNTEQATNNIFGVTGMEDIRKGCSCCLNGLDERGIHPDDPLAKTCTLALRCWPVALAQDSRKGCCHRRNHVRSAEASGVARGVVSECWAPCLFYLGLGVQGHGLPSTPQSPTPLSQQTLRIGQETGFRAREANSSGFRLNILYQL